MYLKNKSSCAQKFPQIKTKKTRITKFPRMKCTWNISESAGDTVVLVVDDKRALLHDATSISHFTFTGTESLSGIDLFNSKEKLRVKKCLFF